MRIKLVSFDSMGVRGMATLVETSEGLIFIDPGSALAPRRYGLPPHRVEINELNRRLETIRRYLSEADHLVITHYHRDHYLYRDGEEEYYAGKYVYAKNPYSMINHSQRVRAYILFKKMNVESMAKQVRFVDNSEVKIGNVKLLFSSPLPHGECGTRLGRVLAVLIDDGEQRLLFASDTQGLLCEDSLSFAMNNKWDMLVISGPPTYLMDDESPESRLDNLIRVLKQSDENAVVILDHHLLRDRNYVFYFNYIRSRSKTKIMTAAEFMMEPVKQLEAYRDVLYGFKKQEFELDDED